MNVACPHCNQKYKISEAVLVREIICKVCKQAMRLQQPSEIVKSSDSNEFAIRTFDANKNSKGSSRQSLRGRQSKSRPKRQFNFLMDLAGLAVCFVVALFVILQWNSQEQAAKNFDGDQMTSGVLSESNSSFLQKTDDSKERADSPNNAKEANSQNVVHAETQPNNAPPQKDATSENRVALSKVASSKADLPPSGRFSPNKFDEKVKPFLNSYCLKCHGPEDENGSLRVDQLVADLDDHYTLSHLQNIVDELTTESMPPEDESQPDPQSVVEVSNILTELIKAAEERHSSGGGRPVRRLTRTEFINTIWDQLGVHVVEKGLPDDLLVGSFETNADSLFLTDMHIQAYLKKSRHAVKRFIASRNLKPGIREVPVKYSPRLMNSIFEFDTTDVPPAGYLKISTQWWRRESASKADITVGPGNNSVELEVVGTPHSPQTIEFLSYTPSPKVNWVVKNSTVPSRKLDKGLTKQQARSRVKSLGKIKLNANTLVEAQERLIVHPVVLGKIDNVQVISRQPFEFFSPFLKKGDQLSDSAAPAIIKKFAKLVKRGREVDASYVNKLTEVFRRGRKLGLPFWEAIEEPMAVSLCSMECIMLFESRSISMNQNEVTGVELANRLSYALWRSAPDERLLKLGKSNALLKNSVMKEQVQRMMHDERFDRFLHDFTDQWLELARQDEIAVDTRVYKKFNVGMKTALKQETVEFVSHLVRDNLSLTNLVDSDFMVLNNVLSRYYGIPGVTGSEFHEVSRSEKTNSQIRGGILTHAGILMQGGTGDRTSIVERGAFIARKLIDNPPGPPPPNVDELPTGDVDTARLTGSELVKLHTSSSQCANCHQKIDPLGMGLEQFDAVGLFRTRETRLNPGFHKLSKRQRKKAANLVIQVPLESSGRLYDGQSFEGVDELKQVLLSKKHDLAKGFIKALLTYINGRKANFSDQAIVEKIAEETAASNYATRLIIEKVFLSEVLRVK